MNPSCLGEFSNFPTITHGLVKARYRDVPDKTQRSIIRALNQLNGLNVPYQLSSAGRIGTYQGRMGFEVGIAEGVYVNYLDDMMTEKLCESITPKNLYHVLDFLIIVTYHYNYKGRTIHLNFDHHQVRFQFYTNELEIRLFHSKGTRKLPLDEFFDRVLNRINRELRQKSLKPLTVQDIKVL